MYNSQCPVYNKKGWTCEETGNVTHTQEKRQVMEIKTRETQTLELIGNDFKITAKDIF